MSKYLIEATGDIVIKNGTIVCPERAIHLVDHNLVLENVTIKAKERCIGAYNTCNINIDASCKLETTGDDACILLYSDKGRTDAVSKLTLNGSVKSSFEGAGAWPICGNGTAERGKTEIVINEGAEVIATGDCAAIYHPQAGSLIINGGKISGKDGIYMKSGKCVVNGGTIEGIGEANEYIASNDGIENPLGHGIVVEFTNYPGGLPQLEVNGGEISSKNQTNAIGYYVSAKCKSQDLEVLKKANVKIKS